jgi:hypothetical protein
MSSRHSIDYPQSNTRLDSSIIHGLTGSLILHQICMWLWWSAKQVSFWASCHVDSCASGLAILFGLYGAAYHRSRTAFMFPALLWSTLFYETSLAMNFVTTDSRRNTEMQVGLPSLRRSLFSWLHQCLWNIQLCTSEPYQTDNTCPIIDYFFLPSFDVASWLFLHSTS